MEAAAARLLEDWADGLVPSVVPSLPEPASFWPEVKPGPGRMKSLLSMWMRGLPTSFHDPILELAFLDCSL